MTSILPALHILTQISFAAANLLATLAFIQCILSLSGFMRFFVALSTFSALWVCVKKTSQGKFQKNVRYGVKFQFFYFNLMYIKPYSVKYQLNDLRVIEKGQLDFFLANWKTGNRIWDEDVRGSICSKYLKDCGKEKSVLFKFSHSIE